MRAGSLHNLLADQSRDATEVAVGVGGTVVGWTDRHAVTVVDVSKSGHRVTVQYDTAVRTDTNGMSDAQEYRYERNTDGRVETFTRRRDGSYRVKGGTARLLVGVRSHYHDYSF